MIAVCLKWVSLRTSVDPITAEVGVDSRWSGASAADWAALELALQIGEAWNEPVTVVTVGTADSEAMLRDAVAAGASSAVRIAVGVATPPSSTGSNEQQLSSESVSALIADWLRQVGDVSLVLCGDWSLDRGTGSVPVFLAELLGIDDACGLVAVTIAPSPGEKSRLAVERRLDGGRREKLSIDGPAVLSVEGVAARLRRAPLSGVLEAKNTLITVVTSSGTGTPGASGTEPNRSVPFRPRARVLDGPATSLSPLRRVEIITGALNERQPPRKMTLEPAAAAEAIIEQLQTWGYLPNRTGRPATNGARDT